MIPTSLGVTGPHPFIGREDLTQTRSPTLRAAEIAGDTIRCGVLVVVVVVVEEEASAAEIASACAICSSNVLDILR